MAPNKGRSTASGKGYWKCHGCQYMVPIGETMCMGCGRIPPAAVSQPKQAGRQLANHQHQQQRA
eukprot:10116013-Karenia_brevis.AAC.1